MFWSRLDLIADRRTITLCGIPNTDEPGDKALYTLCVRTTRDVTRLANEYGKVIQVRCNDDGSGKLPHPEREDGAVPSVFRGVLRGVLGRAAYQDALFGWSGLCRGGMSGEGDLPQCVRDEVDCARTQFLSFQTTWFPPHLLHSEGHATPGQFTAYEHSSIASSLGTTCGGDFCVSSFPALLAGPGHETADDVIRLRVHFSEAFEPASRFTAAFLCDLSAIILACWDKDGRGYGHVLEALSVHLNTHESRTVIPIETVRAARVLVDDPVVPSDMYYFVFRVDDLLACRAGARTARHVTVPWACDHAQLLANCPITTALSVPDIVGSHVVIRVDPDSGVGMCVLTGRVEATLFEADSCVAC